MAIPVRVLDFQSAFINHNFLTGMEGLQGLSPYALDPSYLPQVS